MVSPYQHGDRVCSCRIEECFDELRRGTIFKNLVTSSTVRQSGCLDEHGVGASSSVSHIGRRQHFGLLDVGGIGAGLAVDDGFFARFGKHHELVRRAAADQTGVGFHGTEGEAAAGEDAMIGIVHLLIAEPGARLRPDRSCRRPS